jgi:hypothetical protein
MQGHSPSTDYSIRIPAPELELLPFHLWEEAYPPLRCTIVQRVRTVGGVRPGNFLKIHSHDLPSFLYASKRCSSRGSHGTFILVPDRPSLSSLEHPSPSLPRSESLSLNPLSSSSLLDGSLLRDSRALASASLPSWDRVRAASWSRGSHKYRATGRCLEGRSGEPGLGRRGGTSPARRE